MFSPQASFTFSVAFHSWFYIIWLTKECLIVGTIRPFITNIVYQRSNFAGQIFLRFTISVDDSRLFIYSWIHRIWGPAGISFELVRLCDLLWDLNLDTSCEALIWIVEDKSVSFEDKDSKRLFELNLRFPLLKQCIWELSQTDMWNRKSLHCLFCVSVTDLRPWAAEAVHCWVQRVSVHRPIMPSLRLCVLAPSARAQLGNHLLWCSSSLLQLLHSCQTYARADFKRHVCPSSAPTETTDVPGWQCRQLSLSNQHIFALFHCGDSILLVILTFNWVSVEVYKSSTVFSYYLDQ